MRRKLLIVLAGFGAAVPLLFAVGCAVALAPGYQIAKETREIHFMVAEPPTLAIQVDFLLVNSGTSELDFVDARLPAVQGTGRGDLHVQVDGREVAPGTVPPAEQQAQPDAVRIVFETPWKRKEKREVSFAYTLRAPADSGPYVTIESESFHLGLRGWAPQLEPPKHVLATYPSPPARMTYNIRVPADFAVLAGGARKGQKSYGDEVEYRYGVSGADLGAFAVAGRYVKWSANERRDSAVFCPRAGLSQLTPRNRRNRSPGSGKR